MGGDKKWRNGIVHQRIPPPPYTTQMPQWNELRGTYIEFRNQLIITTSKFTENYINEENSNRLNFIYKLYERGFSNREITDVLNIYGIKKSRTKTHYTVNDVYMCLKKLKIRKQRLSEMDCILGEWLIFE